MCSHGYVWSSFPDCHGCAFWDKERGCLSEEDDVTKCFEPVDPLDDWIDDELGLTHSSKPKVNEECQ